MSSSSSFDRFVQVESTTWTSDSRDLFDFEAAGSRTRNFDLQGPATITRVDGSLMPHDKREPQPQGSEQLLRLNQHGDRFWVDSYSRRSGSKKLWLVVRDFGESGYTLSEGDIIRMGCSRFRVRQLVADPAAGVRPDVSLPDSGASCRSGSGRFCQPVSPDESMEVEGGTCRICLDGGCDEHGPLIRPCACKGSIEGVHLGCLQQWIRSRMGLLDEDHKGRYFVKAMDCDLCKQPYPSHVHVGGVSKQLVDVPAPSSPFIVLEKVSSRSKIGDNGGVLVASFADDQPLTFGRNHNVGFRVEDISISRCHAKISFRDGRFVLEDNRSRFGTLVCMREPFALPADQTVSIQSGSTVLSLTVKHGSPQVEAQDAAGSVDVSTDGEVSDGTIKDAAEKTEELGDASAIMD